MNQNSLPQMESATIVYEMVPPNYENHIPIQIYQILTSDPKLITFNNNSQKNGRNPNAPIQILGNLVGKGGFGQVYKVKYGKQQIECALKIMSKCELEHVYKLIGEFQIQKYIGEHQPQCIIQLINKIIISQQQINEYTIHAYLEFAEYNLWEVMQKKKISKKEINEIFDSILDSILNLHSCKVSHGDIKPQNILFEQQKGWVLADFGCAIRYSQPFGKYLLGGTKAFFPLNLRKKIKDLENLAQEQLYINLFTKDIYAFQLTILFLLYPEKNFVQLQEILDQKQPIHYLIDSLYNKNYATLKQWFKNRKYQRIHQITKMLIQIHKTAFQKYQLPPEEEPYLRQRTLHEQPENIENLVQNKELQQFEYLINSDKEYKFNITRQLQLCRNYLKYGQQDKNVFKFYEAKLEFILGNFSNSREIINNLNDFDYMDNDEQFLQFQILKSRLNGFWWKVCDKIINCLQNVLNLRLGDITKNIDWEFLLMGHLEEKLRIKNKRLSYKNIFKHGAKTKREWVLENQIDHCWEIKCYYNFFLENLGSSLQTINDIEQNFPNYYFNWMVQFLETEYHIIKDNHQEVKSSALNSLKYIQDETCIVNKFRIQFHLWIAYLNLQEQDNCLQTFTMILNLAQQQDAPELFKDYFFYFSEELQSEKTILRSAGFFKSFLERTLETQENLIKDNKLNLFFFQMLSKYYIFEGDSTKLQQLVNTLLVKFYLNNPEQNSTTIIEQFNSSAFLESQSVTGLQKMHQMKFIFTDLDFQKTKNTIVNQRFKIEMSRCGTRFVRHGKQYKAHIFAQNLAKYQIILGSTQEKDKEKRQIVLSFFQELDEEKKCQNRISSLQEKEMDERKYFI